MDEDPELEEYGLQIDVIFVARPEELFTLQDRLHDAVERAICPDVGVDDHVCHLQALSSRPIEWVDDEDEDGS